MIKPLPDWIEEVVNWLNNKFPDDEDVKLTMLYSFDTVELSDGIGTGWSVYKPQDQIIFLADSEEISKNISSYYDKPFQVDYIECLFHEYKHHQQNIQNKPFNENEAERFTIEMRKQFLRDKQLKLI